jgi:N-acetylglutamate synthase-like GNAT family acetyltransferase
MADSRTAGNPGSRHVREHVADDLRAVLEVFASNVPGYFTNDERAAFEDFLQDLPGPYYVMEAEGSIVACGGYAIVADESRADLCWGMVRGDLHGVGMGRLLTEYRIDAARHVARVGHVCLNTSQHTQGFYERLGFTTESVTKDGFSPGLDRCDMRLHLR